MPFRPKPIVYPKPPLSEKIIEESRTRTGTRRCNGITKARKKNSINIHMVVSSRFNHSFVRVACRLPLCACLRFSAAVDNGLSPPHHPPFPGHRRLPSRYLSLHYFPPAEYRPSSPPPPHPYPPSCPAGPRSLPPPW